ncbi:hypothetical protein ACU4GD_31215, partial [Cupriavidus basilensis]
MGQSPAVGVGHLRWRRFDEILLALTLTPAPLWRAPSRRKNRFGCVHARRAPAAAPTCAVPTELSS